MTPTRDRHSGSGPDLPGAVAADAAPDEVQQQGRALGDPTRHRLFRYLVDASRPVGVRELTDLVGLNHNAVRQHLAVLRDAGLVVEETEARSRPGRPRLLYRLHPEVAGSWGTPGAYAWLAGLLSQSVRDGVDAREVGRRDGRRRAAVMAGGRDALDALRGELEERGFRPARADRGRRVDFVLGRCPFADVATTDPDTVCRLHLGLAEGLAEGLGGIEVDRLVAHDARRAGCRLIVHRTPQPVPSPAT
jgi:predicted ArsR family transcriptional regulator